MANEHQGLAVQAELDTGLACLVMLARLHKQPDVNTEKFQIIHEGIDTQNSRPDANAELKLPNGSVLKAGMPTVTYVARNLEPYRGFYTFMRALPELLKQHPTCQVVIVGGDGVSYGSAPKDAPNWRSKMLRENPVDLNRVHFLGKVPYETYKKVLQVSAVHVYLTYPFVLSWSLLEAMATGCLIVGSDTAPVREVIRDGENGVLVDFFDVVRLTSSIVNLLDDTSSGFGAALNASNCPRRFSLFYSVAQYKNVVSVEENNGLATVDDG